MGRVGRLVVAGAVLLAALAVGGYLLVLRPSDQPAPAALDAPATTAAGTVASDPSSPDGTWRVAAGATSYVGYRVREQLAFRPGANEAVGRTGAVTGSLRIAGDQVEATRVEADLSQLTSDQSRRDNAIRQNGLESDRFPTASFELTRPIALGTFARGRSITVQGRGRLTIHGVTNEVTVSLQARWDGDTIQVAGQLPVNLRDYGIEPPRIGPVVSIEDQATMELRLGFTRG